ncbi:flagellar hook-basal body protein [Bacillus sp. EB600]|uniref:flagellar hook-basal body protein n=1 Tax=Bacillus sp. EB600 TaxID=2806345 RepID=UPI00210E4094|nr:flagellar hook-basal body protein [Bacillus sp. EB600]MCQ6279920.1 flagellar hook-basal body protein [Bacillus sp. EB600]
MFKGFYTAASGMLAQQRRTDMLTNNMANANTPGFKEDQSTLRAFPDMLLELMNGQTPGGPKVGSLSTGVYMQEAIPRFIQGDMKETDNKTDMALVDINANGLRGSVFFTVQDPSGQPRYTRNGNFTLDAQGYLTTGNGQYILDTNGKPIQLSSDQFTVSDTGLITGQNGEQAQLGIAFAAQPGSLIKEGNGLYRTESGTSLASAANQQFKLQQGFLEQSNVDLSKSMTDMLTAYRSFEANQKILQAYDRSMEKVANEVGKIG